MGVKLLNNSLYSSEKFSENSQNLEKYFSDYWKESILKMAIRKDNLLKWQLNI